MTKVTIIGEEPKEKKKLKPIQAVACLQNTVSQERVNWIYTGEMSNSLNKTEIKVLKVEGYRNFDCIIISDLNIFLGYFNDGVVEL